MIPGLEKSALARKPALRFDPARKLNRVKRCSQLYLLILLPVVYLLVFCYYPMYGAQIAFKTFNPRLGILGSPWVGFKHFINFFNSYQFERVLTNTLILSFYSLIATFPIRIILALAINATLSNKFRKTVQMVTYMPHFISTVVLVGMVIQFLNPRIGILSRFLQLLGGPARDLLGYPNLFPHIYVWSGIWQNAGWGTIVFLAALTSVDPSLHEAAITDGANRFKRIICIDFPSILPTAVILLILDMGNIMNVGFEKVFLMQNSLNLPASEVISTYVYKVGIASNMIDYSYATAIGLFNSIVNFVLILTVNGIAKKFNQNSLW